MVETLERELRGRRKECKSGATASGAGRVGKYSRANALLLRRSSTDAPQTLSGSETTVPARKVYYPGFSLLRIASAFGVIQMHASVKSGPWLDAFRALMIQERVPTFMLMALFLTVERQVEGAKPSRLFRRLRQLLLPLVAWTLIYDGVRVVAHGAMGDWRKALTPFLSPADQLLGGVWHLYFLAWLATGTAVAYLFAGVTKRLTIGLRWSKWIAPAVVGAVALAGGWALIAFSAQGAPAPGVSYDGGGLTEQCAKLLSGVAGGAIHAVPYIAIALMIHAVRLTSFRIPVSTSMCLGVGAMVLNLLMPNWGAEIPHLAAWVGATCGLVFGFSIPRTLNFPKWVRSAAGASYGIFLCHGLVLMFYEVIWTKISKHSGEKLDFVPFVLIVVLTFLTSWFVTLQLKRFSFTRRVFLGAD